MSASVTVPAVESPFDQYEEILVEAIEDEIRIHQMPDVVLIHQDQLQVLIDALTAMLVVHEEVAMTDGG